MFFRVLFTVLFKIASVLIDVLFLMHLLDELRMVFCCSSDQKNLLYFCLIYICNRYCNFFSTALLNLNFFYFGFIINEEDYKISFVYFYYENMFYFFYINIIQSIHKISTFSIKKNGAAYPSTQKYETEVSITPIIFVKCTISKKCL